MNRRRRAIGNGIGAAIGALVGAVVFDYVLAFEPGGISVGGAAGFPFVMIGAAIGTIIAVVLTNRRGDAN
jgi:presenilin-like A22 family membrane protease